MRHKPSALATGEIGEAIAAQYLKSLGYRVIETNVRCQGGEIDVVAWHGRTLVFVEVKTRKHTSRELALQAVDQRKQRRLLRAARSYLARTQLAPAETRFDLVIVTGTGENTQCELILGAFEDA
ncbi:MAG: YraN family protein [Candidatus Binatia bacterium]|nr:YraN family protein [Candidatus Binatia bacterium]